MDLAHNGKFDTFLNQQNDLPIVEGKAAFEQELGDRLTDYFEGGIGAVDHNSVLRLIRLQMLRVAREMDELERIVEYDAEFSDDEPNTAIVSVIFETGEDVTVELGI
jgi:hypothetical protein